jgi:hypothetical protein
MYINKMNIEGMMQLIIDYELTDSVVIVLHPANFDTLAMDYIGTYGNIERPFEILGIEIVEDTSGKISRNRIQIMEQ